MGIAVCLTFLLTVSRSHEENRQSNTHISSPFPRAPFKKFIFLPFKQPRRQNLPKFEPCVLGPYSPSQSSFCSKRVTDRQPRLKTPSAAGHSVKTFPARAANPTAALPTMISTPVARQALPAKYRPTASAALTVSLHRQSPLYIEKGESQDIHS